MGESKRGQNLNPEMIEIIIVVGKNFLSSRYQV